MHSLRYVKVEKRFKDCNISQLKDAVTVAVCETVLPIAERREQLLKDGCLDGFVLLVGA